MAAHAHPAADMVSTVTTPTLSQARPDDATKKAHHVKPGEIFTNPWPSFKLGSSRMVGLEILKRKITGKTEKVETTGPGVPVRKAEFLSSRHSAEAFNPRPAAVAANPGSDAADDAAKKGSLRATWLGHACVYVEFPSGLRVLFDPVFEDRCTPVTWFGPRRLTQTPCKIDDLPYVDACFISHAHYDHMSYPTIMQIKERHPDCHYFVGLGNKKWFTNIGIDKCTEMDWWEDSELRLTPAGKKTTASEIESANDAASEKASDILAQVSCLPAQHTAARTAFDENKTLWASWAVASGGKSIWFAGDTAYRRVSHEVKEEDRSRYSPEVHRKFPACPAFKEIGALKGPFDLGLIPIGAYKPGPLFSNVHSNPFDAVNIFLDTKCKKGLGMHWGTWILTEEQIMEPPKLLKEALKSKKLPETDLFDICDIGESVWF